MEYKNDFFAGIYRLIRHFPEIVIVTADNGFPSFNAFKSIFPDRFFNFGISETNMILFSAGMASCGRVPYMFAITTFLTMRAYEFLRNDICIPNKNVKLIGVNAGLSCSKLGISHYSLEDIAILSVLPHISIFCPCCFSEMMKMMRLAKDINGPVYIRYNNQMNEKYSLPEYDIFKRKAIILKEEDGINIFATGDLIYEAYEAVNLLAKNEVRVGLVYFPIIKPIDKESIIKVSFKSKIIITVEEHSVIGGFGSIITDAIIERNVPNIKIEKIGIQDFCLQNRYGTWEEIRDKKGLSAKKIYQKVRELLDL